ncbi:MAG: hypothetical protein QM401_01465 [Bacillota bacterium]|nr:hypothetical protein [Bacillota bacterium]
MNKSEEKIQALLEEIELLKLENSLLRKAAGIKSPDKELEQSTQVSEAERNALLKKSI